MYVTIISSHLTNIYINVFPFQLLGCAILGVGIWVLVDKNFSKYVDNSEHFNMLYTGAYVFIAVGVIIMIIGFFGCCGAIRENQCMLGMVGHTQLSFDNISIRRKVLLINTIKKWLRSI